jgi:membrane peptidoglycan carboxypeptidase
VVRDPHGTASSAFQGFPFGTFPLAGKTGTATTNEQKPNSWFIGWGPLPNAHYLIAVVVQGGGYGSQAAAPVVRQGFDYLVAHPEGLARLAPPASAGPVPPGTQPASPGSGTGTSSPGTGSPGGYPATTPSTSRASPALRRRAPGGGL